MILLSTAYFPPIEYIAAIAAEYGFVPGTSGTKPSVVCIEACEHYVKQSWRNRCRILAGDGPQNLNFPVVHEDFGKPVSQMRIDWSTDWLTRHERAIVSAYGTSPYFEYYRDELFSILEARRENLLDFNCAILRFLLRKTGIEAELRFTEEYRSPAKEGKGIGNDIAAGASSSGRTALGEGTYPDCNITGSHITDDINDLREVIHPKRPNFILKDLGLGGKPYWQVFSDRFGFVPGLSVIDLLFNEGPDSILWLKKL